MKTNLSRDTVKFFFQILISFIPLFMICTYLFAIPLGIYFFYFTEEAGFYRSFYWHFGLMWLSFCACLFFAGTGPYKSLLKELKKFKKLSLPWENYLLMFPFLASMAGSIAFFLENILLPNIGIPVSPVLPEIPPHFRFLLVTISSITEELYFRLILLGIPFMLLLLFYQRKIFFSKSFSWRQRILVLVLSLLEPTMAKRKVSTMADVYGKENFENKFRRWPTITEWIFIFFSSIMFGLGHLGWDLGNALSAFVTSLIFGYAYSIYGIAASILLHWFFNCYFNVYFYMSSYFPMLIYILETAFFLHIIAGVILWAVFIIKILLRLLIRHKT